MNPVQERLVKVGSLRSHSVSVSLLIRTLPSSVNVSLATLAIVFSLCVAVPRSLLVAFYSHSFGYLLYLVFLSPLARLVSSLTHA